jgi:DNA-binding transcriptional MerR regulator
MGLLTIKDMAERIGIKYQNFRNAVQKHSLIPPPTIRDGAGRAYYCEADVSKIEKIISGK